MAKKADAVEDWYDEKHRSSGIDTWRPVEAYRPVLDYLGVNAGENILDVGCGTGHLLRLAAEKGLQTYGTDISGEALRITQHNTPHSHLEKGKGENLPFPDDFFDHVVCLGALEHFLDIEKGLSEMVRVSKPDGRFCIMVPNVNYLFWKLRLQKGTEQQAISECLLSLNQWRKVLERADLEIVNIYQDQWPAKIIKRGIIKSLWGLIPVRYTYQFIFILKPK